MNPALPRLAAPALAAVVENQYMLLMIVAATLVLFGFFIFLAKKTTFGRHVYAIEDFGLTREQVRERFSAYCDRFDV